MNTIYDAFSSFPGMKSCSTAHLLPEHKQIILTSNWQMWILTCAHLQFSAEIFPVSFSDIVATSGFSSTQLKAVPSPAVKRPERVRKCDKDLQRPDCLCPSLALLTRALFLSDSSHIRIGKAGGWHLLTCHLPSHAAALIATETDVSLNARA